MGTVRRRIRLSLGRIRRKGKSSVLITVVTAAVLISGVLAAGAVNLLAGAQQGMKFEREIKKTVSADYLLYLPKDYGKSEKKWPLILFLHGSGERGANLEIVKRHGVAKVVEGREDFEFIVVSPQCPAGKWWDTAVLGALLDSVTELYDVDEDRVYCTGLSMGGYATWAMALAYPERFAAIGPICGASFAVRAGEIKHIPAWVAHGGKDKAVKAQYSFEMVDALRRYGGEVVFKFYPDAGHDVWTRTYDDPEFYKWFLRYRRVKER